MPYIGSLTIYSNDGATVLFQNTGDTSLYECTVIENGVEYGGGSYAYGGTLKFIGLAREANATTPTYAIGDTFTCGQSTAEVFYIVESLEGSTWIITSDLTHEAMSSIGDEGFSLAFTSGGESFSSISSYENFLPPNHYIWQLLYDDTIVFDFGSWSEGYNKLTINGGVDVSNPKAIAWVSKFGELQAEETPEGYTATLESITNLDAYIYCEVIYKDGSSESVRNAATPKVYNNVISLWIEDRDGAEAEIIVDGVKVSDNGYRLSSDVTFTLNNETLSITTLGSEPEETPTDHGEIYYNGSLLATIQLGQTVILHTEGLQAATNIVIKNVSEVDDVSLISFTIDGVTYYAEEGMTWGEWCNGKYNTINAYVSSNGVIYTEGSDDLSIESGYIVFDNVAVESTDVIINDTIYTILHNGGSND